MKLVYPLFNVGALVRHRTLGYRGVVARVDAEFEFTGDWADLLGPDDGAPDECFYRVLMHGSDESYVAQSALVEDATGRPIDHPEVVELFVGLREGAYLRKDAVN